MRGFTLVLLLVVVLVVLVEYSECGGSRKRRSSGGGSSSRSRQSASSSRKSRSKSRSSSRNKHASGSPSSVRVHKNTPIPVYTSRSPVIIMQTKTGSRSNFARNAFFGYMFYRYGLRQAPVYRRRYPMHRSTVEIPDERAIRLNFTKEIMLDSNGTICLNSTKNYTIAADKNDRVSTVFTSVRYSNLYGGMPREYFRDNQTVTIDMNALDQSVQVSTLVKYNGTIVANTNCTQIKSVMNGTIVRMYATNPDGAISVHSSFFALISSSVMYFLLQC